jgi:hypothetical protein
MGRRGPANFTFRRWAGAYELDFFACGWLAQYLLCNDVGPTTPKPFPILKLLFIGKVLTQSPSLI